MAPQGTKALVYTDPKNRTSWESHPKDAWYVVPAPEHYRCYNFWMPETRAFCITQTARFYPTHCNMPVESPQQKKGECSEKLIKVVTDRKEKTLQFTAVHKDALAKLATIFEEASTPNNEEKTPPHRVDIKINTLSHDATTPENIIKQRKIHVKTTRSSNPIPQPVINDSAKPPLRRSTRQQASYVTTAHQENINKQTVYSFLGHAISNVPHAFTPHIIAKKRVTEPNKHIDLEHLCNGIVHLSQGRQ